MPLEEGISPFKPVKYGYGHSDDAQRHMEWLDKSVVEILYDARHKIRHKKDTQQYGRDSRDEIAYYNDPRPQGKEQRQNSTSQTDDAYECSERGQFLIQCIEDWKFSPQPIHGCHIAAH